MTRAKGRRDVPSALLPSGRVPVGVEVNEALRNGSGGFEFTVNAKPAPQGSKKHVGGGRMVEMSKNLPAWRTAVAAAAKAAWPYDSPMDSAVGVVVEFRIMRPKAQIREEVKTFLLDTNTPPELWAWFAAYDHVVLSQLFGRMLDLPDGIPMYTHDLRALIDYLPDKRLPQQTSGQHDALADARWVKAAHAHATRKP